MVGEKQKLFKIDYLYTLLLFVVYINDSSNKLNWDIDFSVSCKFRYGNKAIHHMVRHVYTNIQSKIKINGLLSNLFTLTREVCQGYLFSMILYIVEAEVLASFINANERIKGLQTKDYGIKIVNFANDTTIFLRDITCLEVIVKLFEDASRSKINFSKSGASAKFPLKCLELTLVTLFLITPNKKKQVKVS